MTIDSIDNNNNNNDHKEEIKEKPQNTAQKESGVEILVNNLNLSDEIDNTSTSVHFDLSEKENNNSADETSELNDESDAHLPLVRVELDRLNYTNESINNLELELEESKREFLKTLMDSQIELAMLEKKIGSHVLKSRQYYEDRMSLNVMKQKYLTAKFQFETAQELYVAAKNMQMFAEESLELANNQTSNNDIEKMALEKMLKVAKFKVSETELSKQSGDLEQIAAFKVYDNMLKIIEQTEKKNKSSIVKSLKYFELKASYNKELNFLSLKIDGLKSCLKEAKTAYQQSLKNLEKISTEVHNQRKFSKLNHSSNSFKSISADSSTSTLSSVSTTTHSISSPNLMVTNDKTTDPSRSTSLMTLSDPNYERQDSAKSEEEDYDKYFIDSNYATNSNSNKFHYSQKVDKNSICLLSDESIENLRLEKKLKKFESELLNKRRTQEIVQAKETKKTESTKNQISNRPQFRVPFLTRVLSTK